mgnify:CR=1 FL=1|tara:strand:+ start:42239 stop:43153 length:915 start_codon:yes stop_codon:yes gene_type:complete
MDNAIKDFMLQLQEPFDPNDIEWRAQQSGLSNGKPWMVVLPYITSRAIQQRLDEVFGPFGWEVKQEETALQDGFLCSLSILHNDRWVTKQEVSPRTTIEPLKGAASGALKRAGAMWGIGRYLYHLESGFATCALCDKASSAFNNFSKIKDKKTGQFFGVDWMPPKLPAWALPGLECSRFSNAILKSKDLQELNAAHADAYRWASSFGQLDKVKQFEEERDGTANRLADEAKDAVAERYGFVSEWLDKQILNLDKVPDNGAVQTLGARIGQQLTDKCAGQYFDSQEFFAKLKAEVKARITSTREK